MASKTTTKKKSSSASKTNTNLMKSQAVKELVAHNRDYLKLDLTLPLGNQALKQVHTNQWLWTNLPKEFDLANWTILAKALNHSSNRYEGYLENRWYIESCDISVDMGTGKAEMKLGLNAFASSYQSYIDNNKGYQDAFSTKTTSASKKTTNAVNSNANTSTELFSSKAGRDVGGDLNTALQKIIQDCNTEEQKAYCIYDWVDRYVSYEYYYGERYSNSEVLTGHRANCWDTAFLIYDLCSKAKVRCEIYNGYYHFIDGTYGHLWNKIPYKGKMTFADTGRSDRNPIGNHGSGRYIVSGGGTPYRKNY